MAQIANGQDSISYNFITKSPPKPIEFKHGTANVFRVDDINLFMYDVKITSKETEYNTEAPAVFDILQPEELSSDNLDNVGNQFVNSQVESEQASTVSNVSEAKSAIDLSTRLRNMYSDELEDAMSFSDSSENDTRTQILNEVIDLLNLELDKQNAEIERLKKINNDEYSSELIKLNTEIKNLHKEFESLEDAKVLKNSLISITTTDDLTLNKAIEATDILAAKYPYVLESINILLDFDRAYRQFKGSYDSFSGSTIVAKKFDDDDCKMKDGLRPILEEAESLKSSVSKTDYQEIIRESQALYKALRNQNSYRAVSDPIQASKDEIVFDIKIEPKKDIKNLTSLEKRDFKYVVPIAGGVKIDFSTGVFYTRNLYNRSYYLTPSTSDSTMSTINESRNNSFGQVSLGALMHVSPRSTSIFKPSFSFGLGFSSTDITDANFFVGASCIIGSRERFIITAGYSAAPVDYLKGRYDVDQEYRTADLDESELTEKTLKGGGFLSFTYNLTNKPKE